MNLRVKLLMNFERDIGPEVGREAGREVGRETGRYPLGILSP